MKSVLLASVAALAWDSGAYAGDFLVVTDTFKSQREAQARAAAIGGWALDTDAYTGLEPGLFAVVRGPFPNRELADQRVGELGKSQEYKTAYVKDAGTLRLPASLAETAPPKVLAALLGELSVTVDDQPGGESGCEPQEPYQRVSVTAVTLNRAGDPDVDPSAFESRRVEIDLGGFWVIRRTGEIERMRICLE